MTELYDDGFVTRALEVSIHIGLFVILTVSSILILRPFIPLVTWGVIIAIATHPVHTRVSKLLGGRSMVAAALCTGVLLLILIIPVVLLTGSFVQGLQTLATRLKEGTPIIPPPPSRIGSWPVVGAPLANAWTLASTNLAALLEKFGPQIKTIIPKLLLASAGIGLAVLQWVLSILVAGALLAHLSGGTIIAHSLATRLFGKRGAEFEELTGNAIRSVTNGIIGVALIQSILAASGFLLARLPGAGLWSVVFLAASVLQVGGLVLIPAVIYMFAIASTTKAVIFLIWCLFVGVIDNVLKPLLLGRGVAVPMIVVFLGAIGGFMAMGIIGLFVGAIVLSVGYKLFLAWLGEATQTNLETSEGVHLIGPVSRTG